MPRLKKKEPDFIKVARVIKGYASAPQVAKMLNCSANTARRRLNDPQTFTLGELNMICRQAHIPWEDMREAVQV